MLPFGSVIAAHRPLADQTALSGRSIEAIFIGIAHAHSNAVLLFNPVSKRSFTRHSFKYLSDELPPTSYTDVYFTSFPSTTATSSIFEVDPSVEDNSGDFTYVPISIAQAPAAIKFAFSHINNNFIEQSTNTTYQITDIVNLSSSSLSKTPCVKFYDKTLFKSPPKDSSLYEYESVSEFFSDSNYVINNPNNLPIRPNAKIRIINMLKAKIDVNLSNSPYVYKTGLKT